MRRQIILLFGIGIASFVLVSCRQAGSVVTPADEDVERVPVCFSTNVVAASSTKGGGSVTEWDQNQLLYIFGVERNDNGSFGTVLIDNVAANAPASGTDGAIEVYDPAYQAQNIPFYYDYTAKYDFFGYYVNDAFIPGEEVPVFDGNVLTLPIKIDGTQDILLAYANRNAAATEAISADRLYSAYGVRKGNIQPMLQFEHQLSRFEFNIIAGSSGDPLYLNSLSVSSRTEALLTIAGGTPGLTPSGAVSMLALTNRGEALEPYLVNGSHTIGESIMVMPGATDYELSFVLEQSGIVVPQTLPFSIPGGTEKGISYVINLTVYNLESVKIDVTLTPWEDDEEISIGGDDDAQQDGPVQFPSGSSSVVNDEGGVLEIPVVTEEDYTFEVSEDWVHYVETRAPHNETLVFEVDANTTSVLRSCRIDFRVQDEVVNSFFVRQQGQEQTPGFTPEAIDLGLSVKWANCNVGATAPEEYGYYLAWGETEQKESYIWATYRWGSYTDNTLYKYSYSGLSRLEPEDDAATVNWGGNWRTPTISELNELRYQCTWLWTTQNEVKGVLVTGPNGHSIFLPASGCTSSIASGPSEMGYEGHIWAADLRSSDQYAYDISYYPSGNNGGVLKNDSSGLRPNGQSVRGVCD